MVVCQTTKILIHVLIANRCVFGDLISSTQLKFPHFLILMFQRLLGIIMFLKCCIVHIDLQFNFREGTSSQKIWLSDFTDYCSSYSTCLTACELCPTSRVTSCFHFQDMTLECGK